MASQNKGKLASSFEDEYYLLYPSDIENYPLIYEDCKRYTCSYDQYKNCEKVPDCPALYMKKEKVENPQPFSLDFATTFTQKEVDYADCYMALSLSKSSFVVSPKLYAVLSSLNIEGIQFIPVNLLEYGEVKYTDFWYVHVYNILPVLSVKNSRYQTFHGKNILNNLLKIKFNSRKLGAVNLQNRLIFKLPLSRSYFIFHVSVVEKVIPVNPVGLQFIQISKMDFPDIEGFFI
jgi:hypothetical protein